MKKLLGISLVAVLAATPLMAEAARGVSVEGYATPTSDATIASKSYVQGAYKASSDRIDALVTDTNVATNGNYIDANESVAHNLGELDTAVKANADAIGNTASFEGANVSAAISALQTSIGDGAGALGARVTTLETTVGDDTSGLVKDLADEISRAEGVESGLDTRLTAAEGDIDTLEAAVNHATTGLATRASQTDLETEVSRATGAESLLSGRITTLEQHDNALAGTYATKTGVDNTIKAVTLTTKTEQGLTGEVSTTNGSFDIATSWTDPTQTTTRTFLTGASANYALTGATTVEINDNSVSYATANPTPSTGE